MKLFYILTDRSRKFPSLSLPHLQNAVLRRTTFWQRALVLTSLPFLLFQSRDSWGQNHRSLRRPAFLQPNAQSFALFDVSKAFDRVRQEDAFSSAITSLLSCPFHLSCNNRKTLTQVFRKQVLALVALIKTSFPFIAISKSSAFDATFPQLTTPKLPTWAAWSCNINQNRAAFPVPCSSTFSHGDSARKASPTSITKPAVLYSTKNARLRLSHRSENN